MTKRKSVAVDYLGGLTMRVLLVIAVCLLSGVTAWAGVVLTGDTSRPEMSTFIPGETITLTFTVSGLTTADRGVRLLVNVTDEHGKSIRTHEIPVQADASGGWTTSLTAPNSKLGFYRVKARLSNGVQIEKLGSRQAGHLTYCIVPDPKLRPLYGRKDTRFGMQGGFSVKAPIQPYLGIRWILGGYTWRNEEPDRPGQFAEKRAAAKKAGEQPAKRDPNSWQVYIFATPFFVPDWAAIPETKTYVTGTLTPAGEKAWGDYCRQIAEATVEDDPDNDEHIYQITWEPVFPWGFKGTDEQLIRIYQIAYPALHQYDPKALVIGPTGAGISIDAMTWNAALLKKGLSKYLDGYCIHPYHPMPPEPEKMVQHVRQLRDIVRRGMGRDVPIFGTEQGNPTKEDPSKELDHARGLLRENLIMLGEGFRFNVAFYIADYPAEPGFGYYYNLNPKIPYGTDKISPKPIAPAYAAQSFLIEGHKSTGAIEWLGETAWGYAFDRKDSVVLALWDYGDKPRRVKVPVGVGQVDVYDWMGNKKSVSSPGGILDLTLTPEPTYVTRVSPALWSAAGRKSIIVQGQGLSCFPGGKAAITAKITATSTPLSGTVMIEPDPRLGIPKSEKKISPRPSANRSVTFDLAIPATAKPGNYPVTLSLRDKTGLVGVTGIVVTVNPALEILSAVPTVAANGARTVEISLREARGRRASGTVTTEIKGVRDSRRSSKFALTPKGKTTLVVTCDCTDINPAKGYQLAITVSAPGITGCAREFRVDFLEAKKLSKAPAIDGDLADWEGIPAVVLDGTQGMARCPEYYTGPRDLAASVRFAWDESALYMGAEVTDEAFVQDHTGFMSWLGDCIQVGIDLDPDQARRSSGNLLAEAGSRRHSEIDLALTPDGPQAYRTLTFDPSTHPIQLLTSRLAVVKQTGKLVYEAAIPWETLGARKPVRLHDRIGIALAVNDLDDPKQPDPTALGMFGGIAWSKDPDRFGILTLGYQSKR